MNTASLLAAGQAALRQPGKPR